MTVIRLDSKVSTNAGEALLRHAGRLYNRPGVRIVGVAELAHVERTQPAPDEDKEPSVKLRITHLEIANPEQEDVLRRAMEALYLHRTATGTLGEDGDVELSERTITLTGGELNAVEAARMRVAMRHWADYARRVLSLTNATTVELRHELEAIASGMESVIYTPDGGEQA